MSDKAPKDITDILRRPFPKEAIKKRVIGGNRKADYVEGHTVILRLIEATENQFDVRVVNLNLGDTLVTATVELTIPGLGSRQHIGVQKVSANGGEDLVKGAITDALKKAATLFGVALELYGDDYEGHSETPSQQAPPKRQQQPAAPPSQTTTPTEKTADDHQTLTDYQNRRVYELKKQLGIENTAFTKALTKYFGKVATGDLTRNEAEALIAKLEAQLPKQAPSDDAHDDLPDFPE